MNISRALLLPALVLAMLFACTATKDKQEKQKQVESNPAVIQREIPALRRIRVFTTASSSAAAGERLVSKARET
ncbi:MAG: hypothetical protein CSA62_14555 [Planctomycetota bacterium]|nr:MAG: hypothetical protein CSA62_14555 [Planctomycetota bacterium]